MNILTIPVKNMWRKPTKYLLLVTIFSLGIMSIVALYQVSIVIGESLEQKLTAFGANIVVTPTTEKLSLRYGVFHMGDMLYNIQDLSEESITNAIKRIDLRDRISVVAPKLVTMVKISDTPVALVGVRWDQEKGIKSYWATDGTFPESDKQILIGHLAAKKLELKTGDSLTLFDSEFTISGTLFETGSDDDSVVIMDLGVLQKLSDRPGAASFIEVAALCSGCPIEDIVAQIKQAIPNASVTALQDVVNQRMVSVQFVQKLAFTISMVILVTASFMIGLSMMSAVTERKKDIGVLRSLGYDKSRIFLIFCLEAGLIGAIAGCLGYLVGFSASFKALSLFELAGSAKPVFSLVHLFLVSTAFFLIAILSSLYPAHKGASIEPSQALTAL